MIIEQNRSWLRMLIVEADHLRPGHPEGHIKLLGIDVGTGGTRALIVDGDGRVLAVGVEEHRPFASPESGWAEQDHAIGGARVA